MSQIAHIPQNANSTSKRRVLMLDDDASFTRLVKDALEDTGRYEVAALHDASEAESHAREMKPDVILVDIIMPARDGAEVMAAFQGDPELANIPLIVMSAFLNDRVFPNSPVDFGEHEILEKPMDLDGFDSLVEKIELALANRHAN